MIPLDPLTRIERGLDAVAALVLDARVQLVLPEPLDLERAGEAFDVLQGLIIRARGAVSSMKTTAMARRRLTDSARRFR